MEKINLPIAIIIAGALIGGAIIFSNQSGTTSTTGKTIKPGVRQEIVLNNISNTDYVKGKIDAPISFVEFSDLECPFCKGFHDILAVTLPEYIDDGKVSWAYRHFPLNRHPKAGKESEATECAGELGGKDMFWKYTETIFEKTRANNTLDIGVYNNPKKAPVDEDGKPYYEQKTPRSKTDAGALSDIAVSVGLDKAKFESCLSSNKYTEKVAGHLKEAGKAGGNGTPFSIIILKDQIGKEAEAYVNETNQDILAQINRPGTPDILYVSKDGLKVAVGGQMPSEVIRGLLDKLIAGK